MSTSSQLYDSLSADFDVLRGQIRNKLVNGTPDGAVDRMTAEGDAMLRMIQMELNKAPLTDRINMRKSFDARTRDWQEIKRTILSATSTAITMDGDPRPTQNLDRWRQGRDILDSANNSVFRATRVAQENEAIGAEVMGELAVQKDTLVRTRDRLVDANDDLSRTHRMIRTMNRRVLTNKCLLIFIIILEGLILASLVYWKFLRPKK